ncbi:unnamed protein product [Rotaria magnacalcarata]|uniref:Bis(5'-nucleosyl)-tetraphosphatase [asymmetrical] n=1 Tax=Rotaria magnacalcarata TaxID=392030 RepID=A0A819FEB0_9BILA|nr:unnamed protein product [Rotaria magnacalcarata]CAF3869788.1 unnamed protein product [Rotaria magnacalcarata]CAF3872736.1 unnamed protein product [Rotaria magnacalcarata]CAF3915844.1 unnamed protein product [Rotaria magnacalcarata]CAF3998325.1 unnamed protein product [Rotaria magnacalcarata]
MSKRPSAGYIIFRRLERNPIEYLLLQTSSGKHHWTPPKDLELLSWYENNNKKTIIKFGRLEAGESPLQAAERETKEEAGLDKNDLEYYNQFQETITYDSKGQLKNVFYYLASLRNVDQIIRLSDEHQNLCWSTLEDACRLANHSETENVLRKADEFIQKNL